MSPIKLDDEDRCRGEGCTRPVWLDGLCSPCWRLRKMFGWWR